MRNKTAVEWLFDNLKSHFKHDGDLFEVVCMSYEIAKQKEKEQIMQAYDNGRYSSLQYNKTPIEYYNQNYLKEVQDEAK
jgi:hypothetical protein